MKTLDELKKMIHDIKEKAVTKEKAIEVLKLALTKAAAAPGRQT